MKEIIINVLVGLMILSACMLLLGLVLISMSYFGLFGVLTLLIGTTIITVLLGSYDIGRMIRGK